MIKWALWINLLWRSQWRRPHETRVHQCPEHHSWIVSDTGAAMASVWAAVLVDRHQGSASNNVMSFYKLKILLIESALNAIYTFRLRWKTATTNNGEIRYRCYLGDMLQGPRSRFLPNSDNYISPQHATCMKTNRFSLRRLTSGLTSNTGGRRLHESGGGNRLGWLTRVYLQ